MERNLHEPEIYDFRQHDRLWQRVGPGLEPYPETTAEAMPRRERTAAGAREPASRRGAEPLLHGQRGNGASGGAGGIHRGGTGGPAALSGAVPAGTLVGEADPAGHGGGGERPRPTAHGGPVSHHRPALPAQSGAAACSARAVGAEELRRSYHEEACGGLNYARTADGTTDVCLVKLLNELSEDEYRHAERLMTLLERSLGRQGNC